MIDPRLLDLHQREDLLIAWVFFIAKAITYITLLILAIIIEVNVILKIAKTEFRNTPKNSGTTAPPSSAG
jgi:hypothetical protein